MLLLTEKVLVIPHYQHLHEQYEQLQPVFTALCQAYSAFLKPHMFTLEGFVWAAELWWVNRAAGHVRMLMLCNLCKCSCAFYNGFYLMMTP